MPNETLVAEIEDLLSEIINLGGQNEQSKMVPNLVVQVANPGGLDGFVIVSDNRDGDNILAKKVPSVIYTANDLVNVMFLEGGEAIAFQQGSQSGSGGIWEIVPATTTDIFYNRGNVAIGKSTAPDAKLEIEVPTADNVGLIVQTTDDNTTNNLQEWQDSAGATLLQITSLGDIKTDRFQDSDTNTLIGVEVAGFGNLTGLNNTAYGYRALRSITSAIRCVAIGVRAAESLTEGDDNVAMGLDALSSATTATNNFALGTDVLKDNITGSNNVAIGKGALNKSTVGNNVAIGGSALNLNVTGGTNVAIGQGALAKSTDGADNVTIGASAMNNVVSGDDNVAIGDSAGTGGAGADYDFNVMIGSRAGVAMTTGNRNILIGFESGDKVTTGFRNILVGFQTGDNLTTGDRNIIIGYDLEVSAAGVNDELNIAGFITGLIDDQVAVVTTENAQTNVVVDTLTLAHNSSASPILADFGVALKFELESTTTEDQDAARISALWTTPTHASRASALTFETLTGAGALTEQMRIEGDGDIGIGITAPAEMLSVGAAATYFATDTTGNTFWVGAGTGLQFAGISVIENAAQTAIAAANTAVQITVFDTNEPANGATPDHTNDHITISKTGTYFVSCTITVVSIAGAGAKFHFDIQKNNGATVVGQIHTDRNMSGGGSDAGSATMTGLAVLTAADTIEVWVTNETNTQNVIIEDINLALIQVGGS